MIIPFLFFLFSLTSRTTACSLSRLHHYVSSLLLSSGITPVIHSATLLSSLRENEYISALLVKKTPLLVFSWLLLGLLFLFFELTNPGLFFFISFAIGSLCAALSVLITDSLELLTLIWLATSAVAFLILKKIFTRETRQTIPTNTEALIGKRAVVTKKISAYAPGRVKIGGEEWGAITQEVTTLLPPTIVSVSAVNGNRLIVQPIINQKQKKDS